MRPDRRVGILAFVNTRLGDLGSDIRAVGVFRGMPTKHTRRPCGSPGCRLRCTSRQSSAVVVRSGSPLVDPLSRLVNDLHRDLTHVLRLEADVLGTDHLGGAGRF